MIGEKYLQFISARNKDAPFIGTAGHLAVFGWSLAMMILFSDERTLLAAALCLLVAGMFHPISFRQMLRLRWIFLFGILVLVNGMWMGEADLQLWKISFSSAGLEAGLQMALRAMVILVAVDGFSRSVGISEIAGMLERLGLAGLGFSLGVAFNLLPSLRQISTNTWRSLRMRGGLRRQRWRALQLFLVTVMANGLRRGEEIALAAEARAYTPERSRALPLKYGKLDRAILATGLVIILAFLLIL